MNNVNLIALAKVNGFNAGYGKKVLRYQYCSQAGQYDYQVKLKEGWMCLHSGETNNYDVLKTALQLLNTK